MSFIIFLLLLIEALVENVAFCLFVCLCVWWCVALASLHGLLDRDGV